MALNLLDVSTIREVITGLVIKDDGWRIPDELWEQIVPLLPAPPAHPLGCHRPRVPDRDAMNGILFVLRTGCQWNALDATGIVSCSSAYRRFREWEAAGVFTHFWQRGLARYDELVGIDWEYLAMDGAMTKAPLGGEKTGPNPTDRAKSGTKRSTLSDGAGLPLAVIASGANRNHFKLVGETLNHCQLELPDPEGQSPGICLDKCYDYDEVRDLLDEFGFTIHIRS